MQSVSSITMQPVSAVCARMAPDHHVAFGSRMPALKSVRRMASQRRQIVAKADNPISKAVKDVQESAKEFGDELKSNAEDTAEKTEAAFQATNPEDEQEKPPTETYRSTELKNSKEKYTPKSDPKK